MINLELKKEEKYSDTSKFIDIIPGKSYSASVSVTGIFGKPNCGYFGVIYLNQNNAEMDRKIKWLNDFSGIEKTIELIFTGKTHKILLIYRINCETDNTSHSKYTITPITETIFKEVQKNSVENFQSLDDLSLDKLNELSSKEEDTLEKNLIWVFGFARSGTSWLALQLLSYNANSINELHIDKHLGIREEFITDKFVRRYDHMKNIPSYFFSNKFKDTWIFYLRKLILNRIYAEVPDFSKKIVLKEPGGGLGSFDIICQCLPNSKFIILLRDGRDVLDSFIDARQKDGFMSIFGETPVTSENRSEYIRYHSEIWAKYIENLIDHSEHFANSVYLLKYEDLRKHTVLELEKIYSFLEIDISKEEIQKIVQKYDFQNIPEDQRGSGKFHRSATPGKWKEHFNDNEKNIMNEIMEDTLKKSGYKI